MASAAPMPSKQAQVRLSFAKVAAPTYKPEPPKESAPSVKPPVSGPQLAGSSDSANPFDPTNGTAPAAGLKKCGEGVTEEPAGNTVTRTGQWATAAGEQILLQPESKEENTRKPRPSIAFVKFSRAEDTTTQLSSSDGSAKPASLDGKSVASVTTFALDEKESIRPDDSASLRAVEEEDVASPLESNAASRVGSDSEARAFRAQLHEIAVMGPQPQRGVPPGRFPTQNSNGLHTLYDLNQRPNDMGTPMTQPLVNGVAPGAGLQKLPAIPDEKLIEALQSPRDRLFVVKIEQDFIDFIKDSREHEYCLPNCNTFYRMLAHRLADYYLLGHVVDSTMTGVRITRTPYCRIPPPLSHMVDVTKSTSTPPVDPPARKIMRRGDETRSSTNTRANSENPSKAASEEGGSDGSNDKSDSGDKSKDKSALTREEREARYKEARQRIFGHAQSEESDSFEAAGPEEENDVSRTSSTSGKKKSRKQRNIDDNDGFEARSRYNAYYHGQYTAPGYTGDGTVYYSGLPGLIPNPQYALVHSHASPPPGYNNRHSAMMSQDAQSYYGWPSQQYQSPNGPMMCLNYGPMQNGYEMPVDFHRGMQSFQSATAMHNQMTPKMANASMAGYQDSYTQPPPNLSVHSGWPQMGQAPSHSMPQGAYGTSGLGARPVSAPVQQGSVPGPYNYGQFPPPSFSSKSNRNQHPIPGSYQRQQFNPQSQAFVPNGRNMSFQMPPTIGGGPQGMKGYNAYQMPKVPQISGPNPSSANMQPFSSPQEMPSNMLMPSNTSSSLSSQPTASSNNPAQQVASFTAQSSIAKYGTPSNFPARPPPTQMQAPKISLPSHTLTPPVRAPSNPTFVGQIP